MTEKYYAVAFGHKRGVFEKWSDVQEQTKGFPQAVYKKFGTREEAEKFVQDRQPLSTTLDVKKDADTFYAVARGKVVGVFDNYDDVKESIKSFPQPLQKKFSSFDDAKAYYEKFANGTVIDETPAVSSKKRQREEVAKAPVFYAVNRGHKTGVFPTWAECQGQITGFKGAKYKKFDNEEEARSFANDTKFIARKVTNNLPAGQSTSKATSSEDTAQPTKRRRSSRK
jgi:viroplasmin and RNaseH domain-containing protein